MIRLLFVLAFCLVSSFGFSQKPGIVFPEGEAGKDYNRIDAKGKKQGLWIRVFQKSPKVLYYRGQFVNSIPQGKFEFYYETGDLKSIINHVQDSTINDVTFFHPDGKTVMSQGRYVGKIIDKKFFRQKQGSWKFYDAGGTLRSEENYKDDLLDGTCKYYYENGKLVSVVQYISGVKNGPFTDYFDSGKKQYEGTHLNNDYDGAFKAWNAHGSIEREGKYVKGHTDGNWYYYDASGVPEYTILYKMGTEIRRKYENGTYTLYYDDGIPKSEYSYDDGKRNGTFKEWFDIGKFVQVPGTKEDLEIGIAYREKLEGTQVKVEGDYLDDHLEGTVTYYLENGRIEKIEVWEDGQLKETKKPEK
ncbi:MAG: toxin-antitoxin system YwqK family antitoxin [Crocinitomicaceae bacterium]|nr:toxin-antitoxin system YwqK family antitoxin [Crocinitomicaceae bacterium]